VTLSGVMLVRDVYGGRDHDARLLECARIAAIVPAYRDADVIDEGVETLFASNYRNLEIVVVGEPGDEPTLSASSTSSVGTASDIRYRRPGDAARSDHSRSDFRSWFRSR
jgi:hypothetical protein